MIKKTAYKLIASILIFIQLVSLFYFGDLNKQQAEAAFWPTPSNPPQWGNTKYSFSKENYKTVSNPVTANVNDKWQGRFANQTGWGTPYIAANGDVYIVKDGKTLLALNPDDGATKWSYTFSNTPEVCDPNGNHGINFQSSIAGVTPEGNIVVESEGSYQYEHSLRIFVITPNGTNNPSVNLRYKQAASCADGADRESYKGFNVYGLTPDGKYMIYDRYLSSKLGARYIGLDRVDSPYFDAQPFNNVGSNNSAGIYAFNSTGEIVSSAESFNYSASFAGNGARNWDFRTINSDTVDDFVQDTVITDIPALGIGEASIFSTPVTGQGNTAKIFSFNKALQIVQREVVGSGFAYPGISGAIVGVDKVRKHLYTVQYFGNDPYLNKYDLNTTTNVDPTKVDPNNDFKNAVFNDKNLPLIGRVALGAGFRGVLNFALVQDNIYILKRSGLNDGKNYLVGLNMQTMTENFSYQITENASTAYGKIAVADDGTIYISNNNNFLAIGGKPVYKGTIRVKTVCANKNNQALSGIAVSANGSTRPGFATVSGVSDASGDVSFYYETSTDINIFTDTRTLPSGVTPTGTPSTSQGVFYGYFQQPPSKNLYSTPEGTRTTPWLITFNCPLPWVNVNFNSTYSRTNYKTTDSTRLLIPPTTATGYSQFNTFLVSGGNDINTMRTFDFENQTVASGKISLYKWTLGSYVDNNIMSDFNYYDSLLKRVKASEAKSINLAIDPNFSGGTFNIKNFLATNAVGVNAPKIFVFNNIPSAYSSGRSPVDETKFLSVIGLDNISGFDGVVFFFPTYVTITAAQNSNSSNLLFVTYKTKILMSGTTNYLNAGVISERNLDVGGGAGNRSLTMKGFLFSGERIRNYLDLLNANATTPALRVDYSPEYYYIFKGIFLSGIEGTSSRTLVGIE